MKRFLSAALVILVIASFLVACVAPDKQGAFSKMNKPQKAKEEVAPQDNPDQSKD